MQRSLAPRPGVIGRILVAAVACATMMMAVSSSGRASVPAADPMMNPGNNSEAAVSPLIVGMAYVIPPFVDGSKVRTPEAPDTALAQALAQALGYGDYRAVRAGAQEAASLLAQGQARVTLVRLPEGAKSLGSGIAVVPTGYESRPMAILRSDTDIASWDQLRGRTVCLSAGSQYVGMLASHYGARELVRRAPADALLSLRIGECDAAVHDERMLRTLLRLPEWKKFSATLAPGPATRLVFAVAQQDEAALQAATATMQQWRKKSQWDALTRQRVNDIAFEVYLDQTVPDCH